MKKSIANKLIRHFEQTEVMLERLATMRLEQIKPTVEKAIIGIWNKYEKYGFLADICNTQMSMSFSTKIHHQDYTLIQDKAYKRFEEELSEIEHLTIPYDDMRYCRQLLFIYDGKTFKWIHI